MDCALDVHVASVAHVDVLDLYAAPERAWVACFVHIIKTVFGNREIEQC
jgi:hypothetical protein